MRLATVFGTFNRLAHLRTAVASVRRTKGNLDCTMIVIDGGSTDGSREWLAEQEDVVLIQQEGPLTGAVAAFNLGFAHAVECGYDYVFHFNDDAIVLDSNGPVLQTAVDLMEGDGRIGEVAFEFDLRKKWSFDSVHSKIYANFGIVRTAAGMAVARAQGDPAGKVWWNPIYRTYGADSEFGLWLHKLGWKVHAGVGLRVHDVNVKDALRDANEGSNPDRADSALFWRRWPVGSEGPAAATHQEPLAPPPPPPVVQVQRGPLLFLPEPGLYPPAVDAVTASERVLHVALMTHQDRQPGLHRALRSISCAYDVVDWMALEHSGLDREIMRKATSVRPTVVFMQLQRKTPVTAALIRSLRGVCAPGCIFINWDGDQHHEADSPQRKWFVELGAEFDTSLVVNTKHPRVYAELGVRGSGYLQIGVDMGTYGPREVERNDRVVFLANNYAHLPAYNARRAMVAAMRGRLGDRFAVYGGGWASQGLSVESATADRESALYSSAMASVSMSIRPDLPRYTSDRLLRALASGAVVLVEEFPDMEGLGLIDGKNCLAWGDVDALASLVSRVSSMSADETGALRRSATELVAEKHTWDFRMRELMYIVECIRAERSA